KRIYRSATAEEAEMELEAFEEAWGEKFPSIGKSWRNNWDNLIPIAFSKSLSCRQLCLGIITMHYLEQMSRRPQLPEGFNDV
ncbi:transposase, partial [Endozoicomonas atrinae]|uniref:transposase n=1 Tax=Endozoicomonas atrinae TaxID=1333660 RepID=UPI001586A285